jgi:COP9 signalosome complex subunit 7
MGRDLEAGQVEKLIFDLRDWAATTSSVLAALDAKIKTIGESAVADKARKEEHEKAFNDMLRDVMEKQKEKNKKAGPGGISSTVNVDSLMDIDMDPPSAKILRK